MDSAGSRLPWTFLTNHARVLIMIAREPGIRLRDVAAACEVTERTVRAVVSDLEAGGYLTHVREGRRNRYLVTAGTRFRHAAEADHEIAGLISLIIEPPDPRPNADGPSLGRQETSAPTDADDATQPAEQPRRRSARVATR